MISAGAIDPLAALRQATASRHSVLDSGLPLARADASLDDYIDHLQLLARWLAPIAAWLGRFDDGPQDAIAPAAARLALIGADLALAGAAIPRAADDEPAGQTPWPAQAGAAYRWGVAYVVEGSQLGGAVLHKRLAARLAPHPLRYLRADAAGPGAHWRAFSAALRANLQGEAAIAEACAGACAAFDRILALGRQHALVTADRS